MHWENEEVTSDWSASEEFDNISKPDWQELVGSKNISWRKGIVSSASFCSFCALSSCVFNHYFSAATLLCRAYRGGHLTIRLALGGCTNRPFYRIVAAHNKCPRDGRFVEQLGSYDPLPNSHGEKLVALNLDRIRHWIGCGAHLSKPVEKLLGNLALAIAHWLDFKLKSVPVWWELRMIFIASRLLRTGVRSKVVI